MLPSNLMNWILRDFSSLTVDELYAVLRLRSEVFVVEQECVFQDMDNKDQESFHLLGFRETELVAYTRLVPPAKTNGMPSIGRVVVAQSARGDGTGRLLMEKSIEETKKLFGLSPIKIGAQLYLKSFYTPLGFEQTSEVYLEDGIEHIEMIRR